MNEGELATFKKILLKKKGQLLEDLNGSNGHLTTLREDNGHNDYSYHMADVGTDNMEREKTFFFATREGKYLSEIEEALKRIEDGIFGFCINCSNPIPPERLVAVPTATRCVPCKEEKKNGSHDYNGKKERSYVKPN